MAGSVIERLATKLVKGSRILLTHSHLRALIFNGVAAGVEHEATLLPLRCHTVIDIGANRGQFALAARRCFPTARIISFEPLRDPARAFEAMFAQDERVTLHRVAIGPVNRQARMNVAQRDDSSSLLPIAQEQTRVFAGTGQTRSESIELRLLHELITEGDIEPPALLKLDVQGYELEALQGCSSLLAHFAYIYVECSFIELYSGQALANEIVLWLWDKGYRLLSVHNIAYDTNGRAVQADLLFNRRLSDSSLAGTGTAERRSVAQDGERCGPRLWM
jgi:FkbM family methyltransferase